MKTILSIDNSMFSKFDSAASTEVFRNLLWCEARRIGLSLHKVVISLRTNVSDGGIDARVDGTTDADSVLINGISYFQVKAGEAFKPWYRSDLIRELFGDARAKPAREALASGVRECLDHDGSYAIISFGHDLTPAQHSKAKDVLQELFSACGYKNSKVEVLGQGQLRGLIKFYPSLSLDILGKGGSVVLDIAELEIKGRYDACPSTR